jgi:hypothetical protein
MFPGHNLLANPSISEIPFQAIGETFMNPNDTPNPLDQLLRQSLERREPSHEHLADLTRRIQLELQSQTTSKRTAVSGRHRPWSKTTLAVAASLLVGILFWRNSMVPPNQISNKPLDASPPSVMLNDKVASPRPGVSFGVNQSLVFEEMQRVFDQRLAWVAETDQDILMEVDSEKTDSQRPLLCIRLTLASKSNREFGAVGGKVWEMDLIVRSEQTVRIGAGDSTTQLVLWPFLTDDGKVLVETQFNLTAPNEVNHRSTCLLSPGLTEEIGDVDASFVFSQRVVLLNEPAI